MIRALSAGIPEDRADWLTAWEASGRETFAHPDYVALFVPPGGQALALVAEQPRGTAVLPLVRRALPDALAAGAGAWISDAISPYGYGGPFAAGTVDWNHFFSGVLDWMRREHVLTCFVRTALDCALPAGEGLVGYRTVVLAKNVRVDLRREPEAQWRHYAHKVRKNVNKAQRAGLEVRLTEGFADLDLFLDIYRSTMDRRRASDQYYFDAAFFRRLDSIRGACVVADVLDETGVLVSTELVLTSDRSLYSFLGGTRREAFPQAPNDLLKHRLIEYGHESGRKWFVLGGGFESNDGIFRYKRGFDEHGITPFIGVQLTADQEIYEKVVAHAAGGPAATPASEAGRWFPAYRPPTG